MNYKRVQGFSLLESMLSVALGLMLTTGIYRVFEAVTRQSRLIEALSEVHESGHALNAILGHAIRQAGYAGCRSWAARYPDSPDAIELVSALPKLKKGLATGTKLLLLKRWVNLLNTHVLDVAQHHLLIRASKRLKKGQKIILHDCEQMQTLTVKKVKMRKGVQKILVDQTVKTGWVLPSLSEMSTAYWGIFSTSRKNVQGKREYALYRFLPKGGWQEIIPGVYFWMISKRAENLRVWYVLGSDDDVATKPRTIAVGTTLFLPTDGRLYRQWSNTIELI